MPRDPPLPAAPRCARPRLQACMLASTLSGPPPEHVGAVPSAGAPLAGPQAGCRKRRGGFSRGKALQTRGPADRGRHIHQHRRATASPPPPRRPLPPAAAAPVSAADDRYQAVLLACCTAVRHQTSSPAPCPACSLVLEVAEQLAGLNAQLCSARPARGPGAASALHMQLCAACTAVMACCDLGNLLPHDAAGERDRQRIAAAAVVAVGAGVRLLEAGREVVPTDQLIAVSGALTLVVHQRAPGGHDAAMQRFLDGCGGAQALGRWLALVSRALTAVALRNGPGGFGASLGRERSQGLSFHTCADCWAAPCRAPAAGRQLPSPEQTCRPCPCRTRREHTRQCARLLRPAAR